MGWNPFKKIVNACVNAGRTVRYNACAAWQTITFKATRTENALNGTFMTTGIVAPLLDAVVKGPENVKNRDGTIQEGVTVNPYGAAGNGKKTFAKIDPDDYGKVDDKEMRSIKYMAVLAIKETMLEGAYKDKETYVAALKTECLKQLKSHNKSNYPDKKLSDKSLEAIATCLAETLGNYDNLSAATRAMAADRYAWNKEAELASGQAAAAAPAPTRTACAEKPLGFDIGNLKASATPSAGRGQSAGMSC